MKNSYKSYMGDRLLRLPRVLVIHQIVKKFGGVSTSSTSMASRHELKAQKVSGVIGFLGFFLTEHDAVRYLQLQIEQ